MVKVKSGVNLEPGTPNHSILLHALDVASRRFNPTFINMDASFNAPYGNEPSYMGCRSRIMANQNGPEVTAGRGNIGFVTLNLPRIALKSKKDNFEDLIKNLDEMLLLAKASLIHRYNTLKVLRACDIPFVMGDHLYVGSEKLGPNDSIEPALKNGSLAIGYIGLAEMLKYHCGFHHGESQFAQDHGLDILDHIRNFADQCSAETGLNFSVIATPAEGVSGRFVPDDRAIYGEIKDVTDRDFYTNSHMVPAWFEIDATKKARVEGPYHKYANGGHIFYLEFDGSPNSNIEGLLSLLNKSFQQDVGYMGFNYPVDQCCSCGLTALIPGEECPKCGREGEIKRIRRVSGYLSSLGKMGIGKFNEVLSRVAHVGSKILK